MKTQLKFENEPIEVYFYKISHDYGYLIMFENLTKKTFKQKYSFELNNLIAENFNENSPVYINIKPH
jgi:hypothetical protein